MKRVGPLAGLLVLVLVLGSAVVAQSPSPQVSPMTFELTLLD